MLTADKGCSCLHMAAEAGHVEVTNLLVEAGGRELLMLTNNHGYGAESCLHLAAGYGQVQVAKKLVEAGGRELLMLTTNDGYSCLNALNGHVEVVTLLVGPRAAHADVDER